MTTFTHITSLFADIRGRRTRDYTDEQVSNITGISIEALMVSDLPDDLVPERIAAYEHHGRIRLLRNCRPNFYQMHTVDEAALEYGYADQCGSPKDRWHMEKLIESYATSPSMPEANRAEFATLLQQIREERRRQWDRLY